MTHVTGGGAGMTRAIGQRARHTARQGAGPIRHLPEPGPYARKGLEEVPA